MHTKLIFLFKFFLFLHLFIDIECMNKNFEESITNRYMPLFFLKTNNNPFYKQTCYNNNKNLLKARKIDQKELKRKKNYQYALKHMYDKNGKRIKQINKEKKSLKKKKLFDYEGFKVDKIFNGLSEEDMKELRDEELKRKSGEILHNNKYIDNYGVESESDISEI